MQLVLVAGFKASAGKAGPNVRLFEGKYKVVVEHLVDSVLVLHSSLYEATVEVRNDMIIPSEGEVFHLSVGRAGTEPFINVFAEYINGSNSPKST